MLRCLIVDDNEAFLASSSRVLELQGLRIVGCATSGEEGARLARSLRPDVVLVDVRLGDEDGVAVARRLSGATPVVLISTDVDEEVLELLPEVAVLGRIAKAALSAAAVTKLVG